MHSYKKAAAFITAAAISGNVLQSLPFERAFFGCDTAAVCIDAISSSSAVILFIAFLYFSVFISSFLSSVGHCCPEQLPSTLETCPDGGFLYARYLRNFFHGVFLDVK